MQRRGRMMNKVEQMVNSKKLSYFLSLLWITLTIHTWAPFIGMPTGEKFNPIWTMKVDEYGDNYLNDPNNLLPSTELFRYSVATIVSVMTILIILQTFLRANSSVARSFPKYFIYLMLLLAVSAGWYRTADYDTEALIRVIRVFILGIFEGFNSDTETQLYELIFSLTFWVVSLRLFFNKTSKSPK